MFWTNLKGQFQLFYFDRVFLLYSPSNLISTCCAPYILRYVNTKIYKIWFAHSVSWSKINSSMIFRKVFNPLTGLSLAYTCLWLLPFSADVTESHFGLSWQVFVDVAVFMVSLVPYLLTHFSCFFAHFSSPKIIVITVATLFLIIQSRSFAIVWNTHFIIFSFRTRDSFPGGIFWRQLAIHSPEYHNIMDTKCEH